MRRSLARGVQRLTARFRSWSAASEAVFARLKPILATMQLLNVLQRELTKQ